MGRRDRLGAWGWHVHTALYRINSQQATGNSAQYSVIILTGKRI